MLSRYFQAPLFLCFLLFTLKLVLKRFDLVFPVVLHHHSLISALQVVQVRFSALTLLFGPSQLRVDLVKFTFDLPSLSVFSCLSHLELPVQLLFLLSQQLDVLISLLLLVLQFGLFDLSLEHLSLQFKVHSASLYSLHLCLEGGYLIRLTSLVLSFKLLPEVLDLRTVVLLQQLKLSAHLLGLLNIRHVLLPGFVQITLKLCLLVSRVDTVPIGPNTLIPMLLSLRIDLLLLAVVLRVLLSFFIFHIL